MNLIKSRKRVADHGEVFTPAWMVEAMLDLVKDESERIDSRFLEPACGSGNFPVRVMQRKLAAVELKYGKSDFERQHYALLALMCLYGIELLADNIVECRENVLEIFADYLNLQASDDLYRAAAFVLSQNIVHGDALTMRTRGVEPITFAEWGSVYCSKHADGPHSIALSFTSDTGNIWFERLEHAWGEAKCNFCGAARIIFDREAGLETHAYAFIHTDDIKTRLAELFGDDMQFDVIIGNPPYQMTGGGGGTNDSTIYHLFVEQAMQLEPRYLSMVIPSRWMAGGRGMDEFRKTMARGSASARPC